MNIPLYPLERSLLVEKACVDNAIAKDFIASEETKCTKLRRSSAILSWLRPAREDMGDIVSPHNSPSANRPSEHLAPHEFQRGQLARHLYLAIEGLVQLVGLCV